LTNLGNAVDTLRHISDAVQQVNDTPPVVKLEPEKNVYKMTTLSNSNFEFDKRNNSRLERELEEKNEELLKLRRML
jgi:hypothetical protein